MCASKASWKARAALKSKIQGSFLLVIFRTRHLCENVEGSQIGLSQHSGFRNCFPGAQDNRFSVIAINVFFVGCYGEKSPSNLTVLLGFILWL